MVLAGQESAFWLIGTYTTSKLERKIELWAISGNALMWVPQRVWVVCRTLWDLNIYIHTLILAHSFTHCSRCLTQLFGPSVISPGRSEGVSRATSQRPCSKNGRHGYFESQPWPLEHAQKRALSTTQGGELGGWVRGKPGSLIAST